MSLPQRKVRYLSFVYLVLWFPSGFAEEVVGQHSLWASGRHCRDVTPGAWIPFILVRISINIVTLHPLFGNRSGLG